VSVAVDADFQLDLYRRMLTIRRFEDLVQTLFLRGEVYGTTHLYSGQEAVAVGFASAMEPDDRVACTYRGHGHLLARGTEPEALLAELLGRVTGVNGGRAGSMNVVDLDHGVIGCFGIVGGSIAAATGVALAMRGSPRVSIAYFGDGTTNQAYFFECLNFAKVFALPMVFVCENNGYGEYTPMEAVTAGEICARAGAMEIPTRIVDGMDVHATRRAAVEVFAAVRGGGGLRRGAHLSLRRPFAQRSRALSARGRARAVAGARSAGARAGMAARASRRRRAAPGRCRCRCR